MIDTVAAHAVTLPAAPAAPGKAMPDFGADFIAIWQEGRTLPTSTESPAPSSADAPPSPSEAEPIATVTEPALPEAVPLRVPGMPVMVAAALPLAVPSDSIPHTVPESASPSTAPPPPEEALAALSILETPTGKPAMAGPVPPTESMEAVTPVAPEAVASSLARLDLPAAPLAATAPVKPTTNQRTPPRSGDDAPSAVRFLSRLSASPALGQPAPAAIQATTPVDPAEITVPNPEKGPVPPPLFDIPERALEPDHHTEPAALHNARAATLPPNALPPLAPSDLAPHPPVLPTLPAQTEPIAALAPQIPDRQPTLRDFPGLDSGIHSALPLASPQPADTSVRFATSVPAHTASPPPTPISQIVATVAESPAGEIEIRLAPEELGTLRLSLKPDGDALRILITAERGETLDLIRRNAAELENALRDAGYAGTGFTFSRQSQPSAAVAEDDTADPAVPTTEMARPMRLELGGASLNLRL